MIKFVLSTVAVLVLASSPALAFSDAEAHQLEKLLKKRAVHVLGHPRQDATGELRILRKGESPLDDEGCKVVKKQHDAKARGTFSRVVCGGHE